MSLENEPKTVQDYKDVVKILKLKIIKQNKKIQELQLKNKNFEEQINGITIKGDDWQISSRAMVQLQNQVNGKRQERERQMNTLKGKVEVVRVFVKELKKIGITPESVFRIADFAYKNYVESDYFRQVLGKMKLGLSPKEISCLIFVFDESYSGFITRDDYYNSLQAYKVTVQSSSHLFVQQCVFKLSQMMHLQKMNLIKFYEEMQGRGKSKIGNSSSSNLNKIINLNIFQQQIKKYYAEKLSEKQIVAAFNAIDLESEGFLQKSNFLYSITSCINKLLSGDQSLSRKTQNQWNPNGKSQYAVEPFVDTAKTSPKKNYENLNDSSNLKIPVNPKTTHTPSFGTAFKLQSEFGTNIYSIFQELIMFDFTHRLTLKTFRKMISTAMPKLSPEVITQLYKQIDQSMKGSIFFDDVINYYLLNSQDPQMILRLLGKYFQSCDLNADKFWFQFGLNADSEISKLKFLQIMKKNFDSKDQKQWQPFWSMFDKGRGSCNIGSIIKAMQKYEIQ